MASDTDKIDRCRCCQEEHPTAHFRHHRGLGIICGECLVDILDYATTEEYDKAQFERGRYSPREG